MTKIVEKFPVKPQRLEAVKWIVGALIALAAAGSGLLAWKQLLGSSNGSAATESRDVGLPEAATFVSQEQVPVDATSYWVRSGVNPRKADWLTIRAEGQWSSGISQTGPNGDSGFWGLFSPACGECPVPSGYLGELIGRVGGGPPFRVGAQRTMVVSQDGELLLAMNENTGRCEPRKEEGSCYDDNTGTIRVRISVYRVK